MESDWAAERLNQIRTLMDRSASYRQALAPTTIATGIIGITASVIGYFSQIASPKGFAGFWLSTAILTLTIALALVRLQSLRSAEPFWSIPTRRIAEAVTPPFFFGLIVSIIPFLLESMPERLIWWLPPLWMGFYGCGLYSAGFFMPRGIKVFGLGFLLTGCLGLLGLIEPTHLQNHPPIHHAHLVMGGGFGAMHLAYGLYLYLTEAKELAP